MNVIVRNAIGTSGAIPPLPHKTWLKYWESNGSEPLRHNVKYHCPACGKTYFRTNFDGCHVQKIFGSTQYIIPLCDGCNHRRDYFYVDENLLVKTS